MFVASIERRGTQNVDVAEVNVQLSKFSENIVYSSKKFYFVVVSLLPLMGIGSTPLRVSLVSFAAKSEMNIFSIIL